MKILEIQLLNINSLKGHHTIRFDQEPLKNSGIFAIVGPTGSGKTTILDAICLALYNKVPRMGGISKSVIENSGVILTHNCNQAMVSVRYQTASGIYTSEWSIEYNRNKNLNDYHMQIFDEAGNAIDCTKGQVPDKNAAFIGLDYDQFVKAVLLAQGQFAEFLKSKGAERTKLLEKITRSDIYRKLGISIFQYNKKYKEQIDEIKNLLKEYEDQLLPEEKVKAIKFEYDKIKEQIKQSKEESDQLKADLQVCKDFESKEKEVEERQQSFYQNQQARKKFDETQGLKLEAHLKLLPHKQQLYDWSQTKSNLQTIKEEISAQKQRRTILQQQQNNFIDQLTHWFPDFSKDNELFPFLEHKINSYSTIQSERNQVATAYKQLRGIFKRQPFKNILKTEIDNIPSLEKALLDRKEQFQNELKQVLIEIERNTFGNIKASDRTQYYQAFSQWSQKLKERDALEKSKIQLDEKIASIQEDLQKYPKEKKEIQSKLEWVAKEIEVLELKREKADLIEQLTELRQNLTEGDPCPLCGSENHPYSEHLKVEEVQQNDIKKYKEKESNLLSRLNTIQANEEVYTKDLTAKKLETEELKSNLQVLQNEISRLEELFPSDWFEMEEESIATDQVKIMDLENSKDHLNTILTTIEEHENEARRFDQLKIKGFELKEEMNKIYLGKKPFGEAIVEFKSEYRTWQETWTKVEAITKEKEKEQTKIQANFNTLKNTITLNLQPLGYGEISQAFEALLPVEDAEALRKEKQQLEQNLNQSEMDWKRTSEELHKLKLKVGDKSRNKIEKALESIDKKIELATSKAEKFYAEIVRNQNLNENISSKNTELQKLQKEGRKWLILNEQLGDSVGNKFARFAQQLTLDQLVKLANQRLSVIYNRYQIIPPKADEDLKIKDQHMANLERSIKTLSGGETFLISLALALALSDLASKNVKMESLFIDEGFGTLDPKNLDQTLDVLENFQSSDDRSIGLISHVSAMKDRIRTQIRLIPNGQGHSKIQITA